MKTRKVITPCKNNKTDINPFPETIIVPTTANRLPQVRTYNQFIERLQEFNVNAAAFLVPEDMLSTLSPSNNTHIALDDLVSQIPTKALFALIFPPEDQRKLGAK